MTDEFKDPAKKMRSLLKGGKTSPVTRLPKKDDSAVAQLPRQNNENKPASQIRTAPPPSATIQTPLEPAGPSTAARFTFGPPFWTIASLISLAVNAVLVIVLITVSINLGRFDLGNVLNLGNDLLGGLFANFEKMDRAHITSSIQVNTTIPVKFDLQLNQQTNVVLSQDVTIDNAVVTVKTGGLNITNALTTIVLPQGTSLPIVLNLTVPVDTTVPITLDVPVDIPLNQTQLHEPFTGLQDVIKPFYCMVNSSAANLDGQPLCQ